MENLNQNKLDRAKKRVEELKGFYIHLAVYIAVNAFIMVNIFVRSLEDGESFWRFGTFATALFWGIGLIIHAACTFNLNPFLGKGWEQRQIQKFMDEDRQEAKKYQ